MEIIRRKTDYGIRALAHMALSDSDRKIFGARDIAEARGIPEVYMQKVLHALADAGIVRSHRGVFGGFSLVKTPEEITLFSLMEALQGPVAMNKCVQDKRLCDKEKDCSLRENWCDVQTQLRIFLSGVTLADLLQQRSAEDALRRRVDRRARVRRSTDQQPDLYMMAQ